MKIVFSLLLIVFSLITISSWAQDIPSSVDSKDSTEKNFNFLPIPYIEYNRSTGFGFGAIPMGMYKLNKNDTVSPASISGLIGVYTTNNTWYSIFFQQLYFNQDNWRITAAGGLGNYKFQFFIDAPIYDFVDYASDFGFIYLNVNRRIFSKLYGGVHYTYISYKTSFGDIPNAKETTQNGVGIILSFDNRSDVYYPRHGFITDADWSSYPTYLGNETASDKIDFDFNQYIGVRKDKDVIALRANIGVGLGDLPFEQQFIVGGNDIRGYTDGKYRGNQLIAVQGEFRWNFYKKFSAVGFAGLATVFESINEDQNGQLLPAIGCGMRYNVLEKYHMNVGFDIAVGVEDWGFYFRVGEAF